MNRFTPTLLVSASVLLTAARTAPAQYRPPAVSLGAPVPADAAPVPAGGQVVNLPERPPEAPACAPPADAPPVPFLGARYSLYQPPAPCQGFSYYGPGYVAPQFFNPRYRDPGPYFYSPGYPFAPSYYSYYYTPGFFRY